MTYTYDGENGEYAGVSHIQYDAKYNTDSNTTDYVSTNYGFGMSMELNFYLSHAPGTVDASGVYGNKDLYGNDMHFHFAGDDDLWVLVDGELVLDLGGIHGSEDGDINFSTGLVTVNGTQVGNLYDIAEGDHTLTIYYLERGSSQSNCEIRFNLAPRFSLNIQKEDVLTQEVLNGAQFSVYDDKDCRIPSELWVSEESHDRGDPSTNVFTVVDGVASMWGLGSGRTYYIRETKPPDMDDYSYANGIICLTLDKRGIASYTVEIIRETDEDGNIIDVSQGFTVHGFKIDEDTQEAFIIATNAQDWVKETTSVQAFKIWEDDKDHTNDTVTVYLTVTDPDGTVRRIREIVLSEENHWKYTWTNLPKYLADMVTPVQYGVEEAYYSGYYSTVTQVEEISVTTTTWAEALTFKSGDVYLLKTANGCLATTSSSDAKLRWVNEESAKTDPTALWTATVSGSNVKFTNRVGQTLSFNYGNNNNSRYFYATSGNATYQTLVPVESGTGIRFYCVRSYRNYYISTLNASTGRMSATTSSGSGLVFTPMTQMVTTVTEKVDGLAYRLTNIPLEVETSVTVKKEWDVGMTGTEELYIQSLVSVKLLANGKDTGRTITLSLKNGWQDTFRGLPYTDEDGNIIVYSVEESWATEDWLPSYGEMITVNGDGDVPTYETTVTNTYRWGRGYELPATGGLGQAPWLLGGAVILLLSVVGFVLRRKRERRDR
ncbi:MAG: Cna B-type domain-containing protein [Clostridia bacterium]|nr:Cna B-type domain-containing protein [Clostridia bacterium]